MVIVNTSRSPQGLVLPGGLLTLAPGETSVTEAQMAALDDESTRIGRAFAALTSAGVLTVKRPLASRTKREKAAASDTSSDAVK